MRPFSTLFTKVVSAARDYLRALRNRLNFGDNACPWEGGGVWAGRDDDQVGAWWIGRSETLLNVLGRYTFYHVS